MIILGINAYHADSSAALIVDGALVAAGADDGSTGLLIGRLEGLIAEWAVETDHV